jgi:hypothetical protein
MDRRDFIQKLITIPLLDPLLRISTGMTGDGELYLISEEPHTVLPRILRAMPFLQRNNRKRFAFLSPHPRQEGLRHILFRKGWVSSPSPDRAEMALSFSLLHNPVAPSFTYVKDGKIQDIRTPGLFHVWQDMIRAHKPSSCLTTASFFSHKIPLFSGKFAAVYREGKKVEALPLERPLVRSYRTRAGRILVRVQDRKVWVVESSCRNKICCSVPSVSLSGERIICAPNHFFLEIQGARSVDTTIG